MKWFENLSFVSRIGIAMILSLVLNLGIAAYTTSELSKNSYLFELDIDYDVAGTAELLFDTGANFNRSQKVDKVISKGKNKLQFSFEIDKNEKLKFLRLDFGKNVQLTEIELKSISLSNENGKLFDLDKKEIINSIVLLQGVELSEQSNSIIPKISQIPFDPYIVFSPVNELINPLWQRTLLLVAPWLLVFFLPVIVWVKKRFAKKEFSLLFVALFLAAIPLKVAWVTFTSLLLIAYALVCYIKNRDIKLVISTIAVGALFLIPLLFIGNGKLSKLAIQLGFVIFAVVFSILDLSKNHKSIKLIYLKVFFIVMSIIIVSWGVLIGQKGYFYNVDWTNYFTDIKYNAHLVIDWLYYSHTTFLSFFILIGVVFCLELYKRNEINKLFAFCYATFSIVALLILGSRFAWFLAILLPVLYYIPVVPLKRLLLPLWVAIFAGIVYFIDKLDNLRDELWQTSVVQIKENIWFGHGTGTSEIQLPTSFALDKNGATALIDINHSHNQFLTYFLENGVLGLVLFLAIIVFMFYQFAKENNKEMLLILFSILLLMIVESPFKTATPLYLFSFLLTVFPFRNKLTQN